MCGGECGGECGGSHDSVTRKKNQCKELKMEKHSWPVKATSRCVEGYVLTDAGPYETKSFLEMAITLAGRLPGSIVCMASFGRLAVCLECIQKVLADADQKFGYTAEIEFAVFAVASDTKPYEDSAQSPSRTKQSLKLRMCTHNDSTKLTFTWHWLENGGTDLVVQTLDEYVVSVAELAKMTYLSPQISVPKDIKKDNDGQRKQKRMEANTQADIKFLGPITLTYAASLASTVANTERYYVSSVKSYTITAETPPPNLIDMDVRPNPESAQDSGLDNEKTKQANRAHIIQFDSDISIRMKEIQEEKAKEQAFLPTDFLPTKKNDEGKYEFLPPTDTDLVSLPNGLVFYDEIHQRNIPHCSHWPLQVNS